MPCAMACIRREVLTIPHASDANHQNGHMSGLLMLMLQTI